MKRKRSSSSSDDSEDEKPLLSSYQYKVITKNELLKSSVEKCEFCEAVFYNKYNMMVHNASHIIIPLLSRQFPQCPKCHLYFNSMESFEEHNLCKHLNITNKEDFPGIIKSIVKNEPYAVLIKEDFEVKEEEITGDNSILESFVLSQPVTLVTKEDFTLKKETDNNLLESFVNKKAITLLDPLIMKDEVIDISDDSNNTDNKPYFEYSPIDKTEGNKIKDRILFEDDDDDVGIVNGDDLNIGGKVNGVNNLVNNDIRGSLKSNTIILGKYPSDALYKSIHYDELVKPGLFMCRKCNESFPNRYELVLHDTNHLRFKRRSPFLCRLCDWYVANNRWGLRAHQARHHPEKKPPTSDLNRCKICKLSYVYQYRHMRNYHRTYMCRLTECHRSFNSYAEYEEHKNVHKKCIVVQNANGTKEMGYWYIKTVKVCDLCYLFFKNKSNTHYEHLGNINEMGVRHRCERCNKKHFELNMVQLKSRKRICYHFHEKKKITNEDRLKSVQNRLKKLKLMNKF